MFGSEAEIRINRGGHCILSSSSPTPIQIRTAHERFWNWVFSVNDGPNHPLNASRAGMAQEQYDNILIVAGSLQHAGNKNRSLRMPPGAGIEYIFVPADNCVDSLADGGGPSEQDLINFINNDIRGANGIARVSINGSPQGVDLLQSHLFSLTIQSAINGSGRNRMGEGTSQGRHPPLSTMAAGACYYAIISANTLRPRDTIEIIGRNINVTYTVS
jgi:hypothetical protein